MLKLPPFRYILRSMGRAFKDTSVKVGGQAGPIGKGVPMTEAAGPGGQIKTLMGKAMEKGQAAQQGEGLQAENPFAKIYQQKTGKQLPANFKGGLFSRIFAKQQQKRQERMSALGKYKDFNDFYKKRSIGHTFGLKPKPETTKLFTGATATQLTPPTGGLVNDDPNDPNKNTSALLGGGIRSSG